MTKGTWKWPRLQTRRLLTVILTGAFLSIYAAHVLQSNELERRRIQFEKTASGYAALIKSAFESRLKEINALKRFFEGSSFVSVEEFRLYTESLVAGDAPANAIEWIPRVWAVDRPAFESEIGDGDSGTGQITEPGNGNALVGAPDREVFYPIQYVEPVGISSTAIGMDLASDPVSLQALEKAMDNAEPVVVPQVRFFLHDQAPYTFRILYAVYQNPSEGIETRRSNLKGFVAGLYRCADIVEDGLAPVLPVGLDVKVLDVGNPEAPQLWYAHSSRIRRADNPFSGDAPGRETTMQYRAAFTLADRTLEIVCMPAHGFSGNSIVWTAWLTFVGGMLLTGIFAVYLKLLMAQNRRITAQVAERTEALEENRTRLQLALAGANLGYWDWRVKTGEMTFDRRWTEMIGHSPEDLETNIKAWRRIIHTEDKEKVLEALRRHLEGLSPRFESEYRVRHRDGHHIWVQSRGRVIEWDDAGKALRACGTHREVTGRKLANQARDLLTAAVEQFGESLIITDASGRIQYVNSAFERTTGFSRGEVVGEFSHLLHGNKMDDGVFREIVDKVTSGQTWQGMIDSRKKDGTRYYENMTVSPVLDDDKNVSHHVAVRHDLTDLLRLEEEKDKIELQYQQAQKLESIGRLAGGVAHDLNNLLGPILGYAEMIMDETGPDDKQYKGLKVIHKSGLRARDIVRQLLAFSRKESLSIQNVDLTTVVDGFGNLLRRTLMENIRIDFNLQPELIIRADIGRLEQILMNLAVNAQDAMPEGGSLVIETAAVTLDADRIGDRTGASSVIPGRYAMLQVNDTGQGMERNVKDHIFEPFFSTKDKSKGTGLGLAMVYGTVKQHKGYIWADSEPGRGTSIKIYFPLLNEAVQELPKNQAPESESGEETIMVVEDDQSIRNMMAEVLTQKGYHVVTAESGSVCLKSLDRSDQPIDLLLTDVIMPDMNGKELFTELAERFPALKVIYMSGYTDDIIAHQGVISDNVHFLQKPFSIREVAAKVRRVLDGEE